MEKQELVNKMKEIQAENYELNNKVAKSDELRVVHEGKRNQVSNLEAENKEAVGKLEEMKQEKEKIQKELEEVLERENSLKENNM